jgi:hypothetical protein
VLAIFAPQSSLSLSDRMDEACTDRDLDELLPRNSLAKESPSKHPRMTGSGILS